MYFLSPGSKIVPAPIWHREHWGRENNSSKYLLKFDRPSLDHQLFNDKHDAGLYFQHLASLCSSESALASNEGSLMHNSKQ